MDKEKYKELIIKAVMATASSEISHLKRGRVERNITAVLAEKISELVTLDSLEISPFYNKHIDDTKRIGDKVIELDIAVHKRGSDAYNYVAIEIETNNSPVKDDIWKLSSLTIAGGEYGYLLGLFVAFGINKEAGKIIEIQWFENGNPVE